MARGRALGRMGHAERVGGEYQVVSIRPSAGAVSLGFAVVAVLAREIVVRVLGQWLEWRPVSPWSWPLSIYLTSIIAASLGLAIGWFGLRRRPRGSRTLSWLGVVSNATVLVLLLLATLAFVFIRLR